MLAKIFAIRSMNFISNNPSISQYMHVHSVNVYGLIMKLHPDVVSGIVI